MLMKFSFLDSIKAEFSPHKIIEVLFIFLNAGINLITLLVSNVCKRSVFCCLLMTPPFSPTIVISFIIG